MILSSIQELAIYTCFLIKKIRRLPYKRADVFFSFLFEKIKNRKPYKRSINSSNSFRRCSNIDIASSIYAACVISTPAFSLLPQDNRCYLLLGKPSSSLVPLVPGLVFSSPVLKQQKSQSSIGNIVIIIKMRYP